MNDLIKTFNNIKKQYQFLERNKLDGGSYVYEGIGKVKKIIIKFIGELNIQKLKLFQYETFFLWIVEIIKNMEEF